MSYMKDNITMLQETLQIMKNGSYIVNGKTVRLKLSVQEMEEVQVLLPEDVRDIENRTDFQKIFVIGRCGHGCENSDSFTVARSQYENFSYTFKKDSKPVFAACGRMFCMLY